MSWQRIELNMIPDTKVLPVVHASQFDSNRSISFQMFTGEDEWTIPEGLTIELHCRKVDDNIVTLAPLSVDGSVITFITTEQLTACSGQNKCELSFIDADDLVIGSLNFILDVEPDPLKGGLTSASSIYDLTQQIEDITQEVIGDDYYNKTEVDTLLAAKANSADLAAVATSGDYDDLINKPTIPAAQVQSDYTQADTTAVDYIKNKPDINAMIAAALLAVMPVETALGNPCTFDTDIATELQGLTADIVSSGGGGTPSTPVPIVGHSALNLDVNGDTFTVQFGQTVYGGVYDANRGKVRITKGAIDLTNLEHGTLGGYDLFFTLLDNVKVPASNSDIAEVISEAYTPIRYNGITANVDTIAINTSGYLWVNTGSTTPPVGKAIFTLATPIEIDVSELSIDAVVGTNTITSDVGGDVTASYKVSFQKYVDDQ